MNTLILIVAILLLSIIQVCHAATTRSPTTKPKPSTKPTQIPTLVPTVTPTVTPTLSPTLTPTNGPTTPPTPVPTNYVKPELVRNASSKGGQVAGAFLGILFAAFVIYLWYSKTYGPIFKDDYVTDDEHNIEIKNPMTHNSIQIHSNDDDKF